MSEPGTQRWSRSTYPLHPASQTPVKAPETATDSDNRDVSSSTRHPELTQDANAAAGRPQPVTNAGSEYSSFPSSQGNEPSLASPERSPAPQTPIGWSTEASSPMLFSHINQVLSDGVQGIEVSPSILSHGDEDQDPAMSLKPPQTTAVVADAGAEPRGLQTHGGAGTTTKRTQQRTPGDWAWREVASQDFERRPTSHGFPKLSAAGVAVHESDNTGRDEYVKEQLQHQWKRQAYPLASTTSGTPTSRSKETPTQRNQPMERREASSKATSVLLQRGPVQSFPSDQFRLLPSVRIPGSEAADATQTTERQNLTKVQLGQDGTPPLPPKHHMQTATSNNELPIALGLPVSSFEPDLESIDTVPTPENSEYAHSVQGVMDSKSRAYPLQTSVNATDLKSSPSHLPSWYQEGEIQTGGFTNQAQQGTQVLRPIQNLRRGAYPLQSPASVQSLRELSTLPSSFVENGLAEEPEEDPEDLKSGTASSRAQVLYRRTYPLQSPASVMDLRGPRSSESSMTKTGSLQIEGPSVNNVRKDTHNSNETDKFRRQIYPLQPSATTARLVRPSTTSLPSNKSDFAGDIREPNANQGSRTQPIHGTKPIYRQPYPLQASASIPALRLPPSPSPSPPSAEPELQDMTDSLANTSRQKELASKVIKYWRRQVYPLQSPDNLSPFHRAPTPQPAGIESDKVHKAGPIHLPKNLRAVKVANGPGPGGRTIVVCLDGTGDKFDSDNSNIVHLISALKKDDPNQVSYYQAGIGTYSQGGLSSGISAALDMAVGSELGLHVRDAYHFLMHTYKEGDKICIFGFSRGAYTARCLAGMIHKVGLLPPRNIQQIAFAYEFYANDTALGWEQSDNFKDTFSIDVSVYFLGCFDSVASVGFIPRQLPLSATPGNKPRYFRHAMALDERRAKFKVCRHETTDLSKVQQPERISGDSKDHDKIPPTSVHKRYGKDYHPNITNEEYERLAASSEAFETDVLEVWFAGAHADIGGGAVANDERHKLAQIPLRWMIRQTFECNTGIIFKTTKLAEFGIDVHTLWPKYRSLNAPAHGPPPSFLEKYENGLPPRAIRSSKLVPIDKVENGERFYHLKSHTDEDWTPEQVEDFFDAMSPLNDQLVQAPRWWILEALPVEYEVSVAPGQVETRVGMNLGRYRAIDDLEPKLHWTVVHREQLTEYRIQGRTAPHSSWTVVV